MRRIAFTSPGLHDFISPSPDDHIKLFLPDASSASGVCLRDYTPRRFDAGKHALTIDFAMHEAGPATAWARKAVPGDTLGRGLQSCRTILISISWRATRPLFHPLAVEGLRSGVHVTTLVIVDGPEEVQHFQTFADWRPLWAFRGGKNRDDTALLQTAFAEWQAPAGEGYVWIAAEAEVARSLRDTLLNDRGHPKAWLKASGYWVKGKPGAADKLGL
jgi:NADPH-dependent ferric siderophore reductase